MEPADKHKTKTGSEEEAPPNKKMMMMTILIYGRPHYNSLWMLVVFAMDAVDANTNNNNS